MLVKAGLRPIYGPFPAFGSLPSYLLRLSFQTERICSGFVWKERKVCLP